ncbi:MAG: hypothetical protein ABJD11_02795, partial [Gemmatimonadota bacterium]
GQGEGLRNVSGAGILDRRAGLIVSVDHSAQRGTRLISPLVIRASAATLFLAGLGLVFAPDLALTTLLPGYPAEAFWLGQLLGGAWLGLAALNWMQRFTVIGGIYGRPMTIANFTTFLISALALTRVLFSPGTRLGLWLLAGTAATFAILHGVLIFFGPFDTPN